MQGDLHTDLHTDLHKQCRLLIDKAALEEISRDEQHWADVHQAQCPECRHYAELSHRAIQALGSLSVEPDAAAALRVQRAIRLHTERLATGPVDERSFGLSMAAAIFLTIIGSAAMWQTINWLAARWHIPADIWQPGFTMFWLLPSVVLDIVLFMSGKEGLPG